MTANILEMRGIVKTFPGVVANDNVDFSVRQGEIHGLLGENGAGKSTLMNVLYGLYGRDAGEIVFKGNPVDIRSPLEATSLGIGMVHQDFMLVPPFTVAENVALGLNAGNGPFLALSEVRDRISEISDKYGLAADPDVRVEHLSVGVRQRVEIIKLLVRDVDLLILDEPTAVLVPQEIEGMFSILRSLAADGHTIVLITHKLSEVMDICDRLSVLRDGKMIVTMPTAETDMKEMSRLMVGRDVLFRTKRDQCEPGENVLIVENLRAIDENEVTALEGISFKISEGEILGVAGVDGNGQHELAEVLTGLRSASKGKVILNAEDVTGCPTTKLYDKGLCYVPADRRGVGCFETLKITDNSILGRLEEFSKNLVFLDNASIREHTEKIVEDYDVRTPHIKVLARKLSGGNLQKLILGRELSRKPKLLIVEQPTRGLDVGAIEYVQARLLDARRKRAAILLISTELEEILSLSDRIIVLYKGQIMGSLEAEEVDIQTLGLMMTGTPKEQMLSEGSDTSSTG